MTDHQSPDSLESLDRFTSQSTQEMTFNVVEGYEILDSNTNRLLDLSSEPSQKVVLGICRCSICQHHRESANTQPANEDKTQ